VVNVDKEVKTGRPEDIVGADICRTGFRSDGLYSLPEKLYVTSQL
jgi:hypothetical protein